MGQGKAYWDAQPLGEMTDSELARALGVDNSTVGYQRRKRGVSKFTEAWVDRIRDDPDFFFSLVHPEPNTGCWIWMGATDSTGYGRIQDHGKTVAAHRLSFQIHKGEHIANEIDHKCHIKQCVNPDHLRQATSSENSMNRRAGRFGRELPKGVYWCNTIRKYVAKLRRPEEKDYLGSFDSVGDALAAYQKAAKEAHGDFFNKGF